MPSSSYAKQKAKERYVKHAIERRLEKVIDAAKEKDNRYYLLEKVLSADTVRQCLNFLPSRIHRSSIQKGGRKFDAEADSDKSQKLQRIIRNANVVFKQRNSKSKQEMKLPTFYLMIASKLGITNARLGLKDRLIVHDHSLEVCYFFLYNDNYTIVYKKYE
jgi:hypothetical protein